MQLTSRIILLTLSLTLFSQGIAGSRQPTAAGLFYPRDPSELRQTLDSLFASAPTGPTSDRLYALISPHAGYPYSGTVAAAGFSVLKRRPIRRFVVISPSHVTAFRGASIYDGDDYLTPLGSMKVDKKFCELLAKQNSRLRLSSQGHDSRTQDGRGEHAIEVQLPFLQYLFPDALLVPIIIGDLDYDTCRAVASALSRTIKGPETVVVASSDLSHFHPDGEAVALDSRLLSAVVNGDYYNLHRNLRARVWEACGGAPIVATMMTVERLGKADATIVKTANSGQVTGDRKSVVGYASVAFVEHGRPSQGKFQLTPESRRKLLEIARHSVEGAVRGVRTNACLTESEEALNQPMGAFVTLKLKGALRGCIGHTSPAQSLCETVRDVAALAALRDTRFQPVSTQELPRLEYEVSVLSPLRRVADPREIRIGDHGLVVKRGEQEGLLLPQVATERGWDAETFLDHTCLKAGLPAKAWQDSETDIFVFTAIVFEEEKREPRQSSGGTSSSGRVRERLSKKPGKLSNDFRYCRISQLSGPLPRRGCVAKPRVGRAFATYPG